MALCREWKVRVGEALPDDKLRVMRRGKMAGYATLTHPRVLLSGKPLTVNLEPLMRSELA
jgi:hypothetical protein